MTTSPIACTLTPGELAERRAGLLPGLAARATTRTALADGYQLAFAASSETLAAITAAIEAERQCCRFLRFTLTVAPDEGPITLVVDGPAGTRAFLDALLG